MSGKELKWSRRILATALSVAICAAANPAPATARAPAEFNYPAYHGPKKTIAVSAFDGNGSFVASYGGWNAGGGLAAMLAAELAKTNRFVVVERADIDALLNEKQMTLSNVSEGGSARPLLGVQTLIHGSVTEFDQEEKGGGLNLGLNVGGMLGGLGGRRSSGHVTVNLRLIDAATGAIIGSYKVDHKISGSSVALQGRARNLSLGADQFSQSSVGKAVQEAIAESVANIVMDMERVPWRALVADVDGERVFINAGRNANLVPGTTLRAVRRERAIIDPASGEVLGGEDRTIGDLIVERTEERFAIGRWVSTEAPRKGDVLHLASN